MILTLRLPQFFVCLLLLLTAHAGYTAEHPLDALFAGRAHLEEVRTIDFTALNHGQFEGNTASMATWSLRLFR